MEVKVTVNMISTRQASELSGYSERHLRLLATLGRISGQKIAGVWLLDRDSVVEYGRRGEIGISSEVAYAGGVPISGAPEGVGSNPTAALQNIPRTAAEVREQLHSSNDDDLEDYDPAEL